jgi:DNA-binding transcriptional regulator YiaG
MARRRSTRRRRRHDATAELADVLGTLIQDLRDWEQLRERGA